MTLKPLFFRLCMLASLFFATSTLQARPQDNQDTDEENHAFDSFSVFREGSGRNQLTGGLGVSVFDNQVFYNIYLAPELVFGKVGVGFDLNLRIGENGQLRKEDWNDGAASFLRLIRYVRYGTKHDSLYARIGQLDAARLGHGSIMYLYRNNASYDTRKVGLEFDLDFADFGFESMVSDLTTFDIVGVRSFVRPLRNTKWPIIGNLEVGATYAGDFRDNTNLIATAQSLYPKVVDGQQIFNPALGRAKGSLNIWGLDLGVPIIRTSLLDVDAYTDFVKIVGYGSGGLFGVSGTLKNLSQFLTLSARLEHRIVGDQFQFSYFDPLYEQDRYSTALRTSVGDTAYVRTRANELAKYSSPGPGIYADLGASVLNIVHLFGSYQRLYKTERGGQLHLGARFENVASSVLLRADYYKRDIGAESDVFKLDDRSLSVIEFGYYPQPYLLLSIVYQWTYLPVRKGGDVIGYDPIRRVEPRVSIHFEL